MQVYPEKSKRCSWQRFSLYFVLQLYFLELQITLEPHKLFVESSVMLQLVPGSFEALAVATAPTSGFSITVVWALARACRMDITLHMHVFNSIFWTKFSILTYEFVVCLGFQMSLGPPPMAPLPLQSPASVDTGGVLTYNSKTLLIKSFAACTEI
jgi:hypothetical protein